MSKGLRPSKIVGEIKPAPIIHLPKDIGFIIFMLKHDIRREPILERIWEYVMGEEHILIRLERYGQDSNFWKNEKTTATA